MMMDVKISEMVITNGLLKVGKIIKMKNIIMNLFYVITNGINK